MAHFCNVEEWLTNIKWRVIIVDGCQQCLMSLFDPDWLVMEEEEEEKRSDTPERKDKDDSEKKNVTTDSCTKLKEQDLEEKEQDTAEVEGAHAVLELEENVESKEEKESSTKSKDGEAQKVNGESSEAGSDVSLLSPKRHLERQVKYSSCHLNIYSSFTSSNSIYPCAMFLSCSIM